MAHEKNHDYHILHPSIWPLSGAVSTFIMLVGAAIMLHHLGRGEEPITFAGLALSPWLFIIGLFCVLFTMFSWWWDVIDESHVGDHTSVVRIGLRYGVILFIVSEIMFFVAWFWSFFKYALYPLAEGYPAVAGVWPPEGIKVFDPWHLPLINTLILLCSGCFCTWAHHALVHENNRNGLIWGLFGAIVLGVLFTIFQAYEYGHAGFAYAGNIYGANFFMATGFHGFHVIIGTIFLTVCLIRALNGHFTQENHIGLEAAAWYWHFVDVVWLFLFFTVYIWGG